MKLQYGVSLIRKYNELKDVWVGSYEIVYGHKGVGG